MKQHDITKICADSLRAFTNDNYGVKLKSSHAHELVAVYLGYKSKAALLADTTAPLNNLRQSLYIVLAPTAPIDQRRQELQDLSPDLPNTYILSEGVYAGLISEKLLLKKPWPTLWPTHDLLASALTDEYLRQQKMEHIHYKPTGESVKVERTHEGLLMIVKRFYQIPTHDGPPTHNTYLTTSINLPRIAAHIGYGMPSATSVIEKRKIGEDSNF